LAAAQAEGAVNTPLSRLAVIGSLIIASMAQLFVALFLLVFGLNLAVGLAIPNVITGVLALIAGVMLLVERYRIHIDRK
jgi:putative exporter of polyketide antibiotics